MTPGMPLVDWSPLVLSAGAENSARAPLARDRVEYAKAVAGRMF
jgi:hypothetical protein